MDSDHATPTTTHENAVERIRQELVDLKTDGWTKRRRRLGELEQRQQHYELLHSKWKRSSQKQPLHMYIQELTDVNHLIPQTILGKQAKLAQCLHLMEVYMQQMSLMETHHREYAQLLALQAGQEEDEQSKVTLELMNDLCILDTELQELREKLKELKSNDSDEKNQHEEEETTSHNKKNATNHVVSQQQDKYTNKKKNPWWWPIHHGDDKQKPPLTNTAEDVKSVASDTSSLMDLLWMPAKFKSQATSPKTTTTTDKWISCQSQLLRYRRNHHLRVRIRPMIVILPMNP